MDDYAARPDAFLMNVGPIKGAKIQEVIKQIKVGYLITFNPQY
jgi:hypothetical protein